MRFAQKFIIGLRLKISLSGVEGLRVVSNGRIEKDKKTKYIIKKQKSPESTSSIPNFSETKKPKNPAKIAAAPPETVSYAGEREYFNLVQRRSLRKKLILIKLNHVGKLRDVVWGAKLISLSAPAVADLKDDVFFVFNKRSVYVLI